MKIAPALILLVVICLAVWWFLLRGGGGDSMSPSAFVAEHDPDGLILDVRTPREFARGHLDGALNVNISDRDFRQRVEGFDRATPVYLYCGSGHRSGRAAGILKEMGFEHAFNVGGFGALKAAGAAVAR